MKVPGVTWDAQKRKWWARLKTKDKRFHLGYWSDWFDACCARKAAENEHKTERFHKADPFDYPLKDCPYCHKQISKVSRKGKILKRGHYAQKKTCGKWECIKRAQQVELTPVRFESKDAIDLFITGRI